MQNDQDTTGETGGETGGTTGGTTGGGTVPVLGIDAADAVLKEIITIANYDFLPQFLPIVSEEYQEMMSLWRLGGNASSDSYALIEGSAIDPSEVTQGGGDGGRYTCLAGGSAALPSILGGRAIDSFNINFDRCVTLSDTLGTTVTLDGEASVFPLPDGSYSGPRLSSIGYSNLTVSGDGFELAINGSSYPDVEEDGERWFGETTTRVSSYASTTADGESATVVDYSSVVRTMNEGGGPEDNRNASAVIDFAATTPGTAGQTLDVGINLAYDRTGTAAEDQIDQWDSGQISVAASDGSSLRAEPISDDPTTLRIIVGDEVIERLWSEGYQIDCVGNLSGCR